MKTYVIGDTHGCFNTFKDLLIKINYDKSVDRLILLGDYIDRGRNSKALVEFLINLQKEIGDRCICILGNHEDMAIRYIDKEIELFQWERNGALDTLDSYKDQYGNFDRGLFKTHVDWMRSLPLYYEHSDCVMCHAGMPNTMIADNTKREILWDRDWIDEKKFPNEKLVIFGHTPRQKVYKSVNGNICIDTACVYGYYLTALCLDNMQYSSVTKNELD